MKKAKRQKKEPKGKRKSQRAKEKSQKAKTVIEKNHTKTHPVLNLRYQNKKGTLRNKGCAHKKEPK